MTERRSFRHGFAWVLGGSAGFALSQFLLLVVIAKLGSPRLAGDWTIALAITGPVFVFARFKLRAMQASDARGEFEWRDYSALTVVGSLGAICGMVAVATLGYRDATAFAILTVGLSKGLDAGSELVYGQEQLHERMHQIATSQLLRGLLAVTLGTLAFYWTRSAGWIGLAVAAAYLIGLTRDLRRVRAIVPSGRLAPGWDGARLRRLARRAIPLGIVTAIGALQANLPRYFLEAYRGRDEVGIYGTLAFAMSIGGLLVNALAHTGLPRMARAAAAQDWTRFRHYVWRLMALGFVIAGVAIAVCVALGEVLLRVVFSAHYAAHADVLVWLAAASGMTWVYVFLGTSLDAMRRFSIQPWIHGTSTLVIAGACFALVPAHGMRGAAWALMAGYGVEALLYLAGVMIPLRAAARTGIARPPPSKDAD